MLVADEGMIGGQLVKILDFGIAKIFNDDEGDGTQTAAGDQQPGTPAYMPPEQFKPLDKAGDPGKMDVYALGVIGYQMLAGRLPLWNPDRFVLTMQVMTVDPDPLTKIDKSLPLALTTLVHQMLAKEPEARPSMEQVREHLASYLGLGGSNAETLLIRPTREIHALVPLPHTGELGAVSTEDTPSIAKEVPAEAVTPSEAPTPDAVTPLISVNPKADPKGEITPATPAWEPLDEHLSSGGVRGTSGQQVSSGQTRSPPRPTPGRLWVGGGLALAAVLALAGLKMFSRPAMPTPMPAKIVQPAPLLDTIKVEKLEQKSPVAMSDVAVTPVAANAETTGAHSSKSHASCTPIAPKESCITGALTGADKTAFVTALDEADVKLCNGDHLTVVSRPNLTVKSSGGVRRSKQEHFLLALRGTLKAISFSGEVVVRCKAR